MSFILKSIFEGIEAKERAAGKLYKDLALKTKNQEIKEALITMSKEELGHEDYFDPESVTHLKEVDAKDFEDISKKLTEEVTFNMSNVLEVIEKAIAEETFAEKAYLTLSAHLPDDLKECLIEFAKQESLHREVLVRLKAEFKESDWN